MKDKENNDIKNEENNETISEEELNIFNNKLHSILKGVNALKTKFDSLLDNIRKDDYELQYGLSFFESKQDMMMIYITNLLNYCKAKIEGSLPINNLPFIEDNIKIASLIERTKVIEMKLQHLINKTINANNDEKKGTNEIDLKPKILSAFGMNEEDEEENSEEEIEKKAKKKEKKKKIYMDKSELYKVKNENIDFYENKKEKKNRRRQQERDKEKIRNSETMRNLREEMSDNPTMFDNDRNSYLNKYMKEIEKYENDHFVNITVPKKVIKQLKKKDNNVDDLYKIDTNLKILSSTLYDKNYIKDKKDKDKFNPKKSKSFLNKKRIHK